MRYPTSQIANLISGIFTFSITLILMKDKHKAMSKVYIETYGCQMNEYDTELVKTILKKNDFDFTDKPEDAQIIFLNTCSVRENAHQKVHQRLGVFRQLRKENKNLIMGVLGCMAQNLRKELLEKKIGVDIVAGKQHGMGWVFPG